MTLFFSFHILSRNVLKLVLWPLCELMKNIIVLRKCVSLVSTVAAAVFALVLLTQWVRLAPNGTNPGIFLIRFSKLCSVSTWPSGKLPFDCQKIAKNLTLKNIAKNCHFPLAFSFWKKDNFSQFLKNASF